MPRSSKATALVAVLLAVLLATAGEVAHAARVPEALERPALKSSNSALPDAAIVRLVPNPRQSASNAAVRTSKWSLTRSTLTVKPKCCFFCQLQGEVCYDQANHQRRHELAHITFSMVNQMPPAFCTPKIACTINGSPFKSNANTRTQPDNHYVVTGDAKAKRHGSPVSPSATYTAARATIGLNSVLRLEAAATLQLTGGSRAAFQSAWLTLQEHSTLTAVASTLAGTLQLARIESSRLALRKSALTLTDSPALIIADSLVQAASSNLTFAISSTSTIQKLLTDPVPFIFSGSKLQLSDSTLSFSNHPDVFFDNAHVTLHDSALRVQGSNVRFFDSVLELSSACVSITDSQVWLFNTTLLHDKKVTQVKGDAPVKLGDVFGKKSCPGTAKATGCFQLSQ